jgi:hypothetical protein
VLRRRAPDPALEADLAVYGDIGIAATGALNRVELDGSALRETPSTSLSRRNDAGNLLTSMALVAMRKEARAEEPAVVEQCFPFTAQPLRHLLLDSVRDGRSVKKLHELIDGIRKCVAS